MLLNHNDTLDAVFTLAHEMGHSMHTLLSHPHQPFVYAGYTIFVAEVPSTLSEALFLDYMLSRTTDQRERIVLLQHAIDGIVSTFYTQVMFADYELQAHRLVEAGQPVTADGSSEIYFSLLEGLPRRRARLRRASRVTWARIPHFYSTPYYVYQYATCFASSAQLIKRMTSGSDAERAAAIDRYLTLLKSGGSDHPMTLLQRAGVDLSRPRNGARSRRSARHARHPARESARYAVKPTCHIYGSSILTKRAARSPSCMSGSRSVPHRPCIGLRMEASPESFGPTASTAASCRWCLRSRAA